MAVNLTVSALLAALRMTDTAEETAEATRLLAFGTLLIEQHAPFAPETAQNEAVIRVCGYLFDQPFAGRSSAYANALRNSGAQSLLLAWVVHRAGNVEEAVASAMASGSANNPVVALGVSGDQMVVGFADGSTQNLTLPAGMAGIGTGVDQDARDLATLAQTTALNAQTTADSAEGAAQGAQGTADVAQDAATNNAAALANLPTVASLVSAWALAGNVDRLPENKTERVHVFESNAVPAPDAGGDEHDLWFRPVASGIEIYLHNGSVWQKRTTINLPFRITDQTVNINDAEYSGLPEGGHVAELAGGTLKVYQRNSSATAPFLSLLGATTGGGGTAGGALPTQIGTDTTVQTGGGSFEPTAATATAFITAWDSGLYSGFLFEFTETVGSGSSQTRDIFQVPIARTFATIPQTQRTEFQAPWAWTNDPIGPFKLLVNPTGATDSLILSITGAAAFESDSVLRIWGLA